MKNILVLAAIGFAVVFAARDCSWKAKSKVEGYALNANFDLTPLSGYDYAVRDIQASTAWRNFTYYFSFCGTVDKVPITRGGAGVTCYKTGEEEPVHYPAYQVSQSGDSCMRLGVDAKVENVRWNLLDQLDPSLGVSYMYIDGDTNQCGVIARSLEIQLKCADDEYNIPDEESATEDTCHYSFSFNSMYGCPTECGSDRHRLCGGKGVCKFDLDTRTPHCYCHKGWTGFSCADKGENKAAGFNSTAMMLLIVLVFLALVEAGVIAMWNKVKRLRLDPNAYTSFAAADEMA